MNLRPVVTTVTADLYGTAAKLICVILTLKAPLIVCSRRLYQIVLVFFSKIGKDVAKLVVCDRRFKS